MTLDNVSLERQILENVSLVIPSKMMPKNLSLDRQILTIIVGPDRLCTMPLAVSVTTTKKFAAELQV